MYCYSLLILTLSTPGTYRIGALSNARGSIMEARPSGTVAAS